MFNLRNLANKLKSVYKSVVSTITGATKGNEKTAQPLKQDAPYSTGDFMQVSLPNVLTGMSVQEVITHFASSINKSKTEGGLISEARTFAKWLNTHKTNKGTVFSVNYKRDIRKRLVNEVKGLNTLRIGLEGELQAIANKYPAYSSEIMSIVRDTNNTNYQDAEIIGRNKKLVLDALGNECPASLIDLDTNSHAIHWLYRYSISISEIKAGINKQNDNREYKNRNLTTVKMADVTNAIESGLKSDAYSVLMVALALATGRRAIELLVTGEFIARDGDKSIMFGGQAKKQKGMEIAPYPIYVVGCSANDVIEGIKKLRNHKSIKSLVSQAKSLKPYKRNTFITQQTSSVRLDTIRRMLNTTLTFKDARSIYATICSDSYLGKGEYINTDISQFLKDLLGHDDDKSQLNYKGLKIDYVSTASESEIKSGISAEYQGQEATAFDSLDSLIENADIHTRTKNATLKLNNKIKEFARLNPTTVINKTLILKGFKVSTGVADTYLGAINRAGEVVKVGIAENVVAKYNASIQQGN